MVIDVIDYTEKQLSLLSEEQLLKVEDAQMKKNRLQRALAKKLQEEKRRLINNGLFLSYTWAWTKEYWEKVYAEEIGSVKDGLLFYLQYQQNVDLGEDTPYELDYALSIPERMDLVRGYYERTYTDPQQRYEALKADKVAARYLCDAYKSLLAYFMEQMAVN